MKVKFTTVISVVPKGLCISPKPNILHADTLYIYVLSSEKSEYLEKKWTESPVAH